MNWEYSLCQQHNLMVNKIAITQPFPLTNGGQSTLANGETSARNGGGNPVGINPKNGLKPVSTRALIGS